jgi:hypothetical protein
MLIEEKSVVIDGRNFVLSKFPAIAGREIVVKYPISALPKLGDYKTNEETMFKLMAFVGIPTENGTLRLTTPALIDNHTGNWETLMRVEAAMMEYNVSFFQGGRVLSFFDDFAQKVRALSTQILTALSGLSSRKARRRSTN